jgi:hypothetical protein
VAEAESTGQKAPVVTGVCVGGCLVVIAGLIVGLAAEAFAWTVIANSWSYCFNVPWPVAYDMADSPRFYIFEGIGYLVLYWLCVPTGFWIARRVFSARGRFFRIAAGLLSAVVLLSIVFAGDLMLNISARDGMYLPARCPAGHPPWWPGWIPARDSPNPCGTGPCLGAGA